MTKEWSQQEQEYHAHHSEPHWRNQLGPGLHLNAPQSIVIGLALLYWLWPFDLLPLIPIDDIIVMVVAVSIAGMLGLLERG